jgi:hypothetical protein
MTRKQKISFLTWVALTGMIGAGLTFRSLWLCIGAGIGGLLWMSWVGMPPERD